MRAPESFTTVFAAAGTKAIADAQGQSLRGGVYQLAAHSAAWGGGNAQLQQLGPDGATYLNVGSQITADGVQGPLYLPPGVYQWVLTTTTAASLQVNRVPME